MLINANSIDYNSIICYDFLVEHRCLHREYKDNNLFAGREL